MDKRRAWLCALLWLGVATAGHAMDAASGTSAGGYVPPPPGSKIVFLPVTSLHSDYAAAEPAVAQALADVITGAGLQALMLDADNHRVVWAQELRAAGAVVDAATGQIPTEAYGRALATLSRRIARETGADLVLQPMLVLRPAELVGTKALWDGRSELVPTRDAGDLSVRFKGTYPAVSLQVIALHPDGRLAFRRFGGLSLPLEMFAIVGNVRPKANQAVDAANAKAAARIALSDLLASKPD